MKRTITFGALFLLLAGCVSPDDVLSHTTTAESTVDAVTSTIGDLVHSYALVSLSITDDYSSASDFRRIAQFTYLSPLDGYYKTVNLDEAGTPHSSVGKTTLTGMALVAPPLVSAAPDPNDPSTLAAAISSLATLTGSPAAGARISYWLTAMSGADVWAVTTYYKSNGTTVQKFLDVATNTVTGLSPSPPTPGVPAIDVPGITGLEGRPYADLAAEAWAPDATLFNIVASERGFTSFGEVKFISTEKGDSIFIPADHTPADGRSPVWGYVYVSETLGLVRPFYVYMGFISIPGTPIVPHYPTSTYASVTVPSSMIDTTTVVEHLRPPLNGTNAFYSVHDANPHLWWHMDFGGDDYLRVRGDGLTFACIPDIGCDI